MSEIHVRRLGAAEARERVDELAAVLEDCVAGGASVGYLTPFSLDDARAAFEGFLDDAERGGRIVFAAFDGRHLVGTAQLVLAQMPNQPHRGEIAKMLVRREARRRGVAAKLLEAAESVARAEGLTLLVLDAVTGDDAARLYERLGWTTVGEIPDYALYPDGRLCATTYFYKRV
jgi:GNAT superfamily N-acetyltransferase